MAKRKREDAKRKESAFEALYRFVKESGEVSRPRTTSPLFPAVIKAIEWWCGKNPMNEKDCERRRLLRVVSSWWKDRKKRIGPHMHACQRLVQERLEYLRTKARKCCACKVRAAEMRCVADSKSYCTECMLNTHECSSKLQDHVWTMVQKKFAEEDTAAARTDATGQENQAGKADVHPIVPLCAECGKAEAKVQCTTCTDSYCVKCMMATHSPFSSLRKHKWTLVRHMHSIACKDRHRAVRVRSYSDGNEPVDDIAYLLEAPCCSHKATPCKKRTDLPSVDEVTENRVSCHPRAQHHDHVDYVHEGNLYHVNENNEWVTCGEILDMLDDDDVTPLLENIESFCA